MLDRRLRIFPSVVKSINDLPPGVREIAQRVQPTLRQIIKLPPHEYPVRRTAWHFDLMFRWLRTPERYLIFGDTQIVIADLTDGGVTATEIPLAALIDLRLTGVLLYACVELAWISGDQIATKKLEFNAVGARLVENALREAQSTMTDSVPIPPDPQIENILKALPLKFYNYLDACKLPEEQFEAILYQPAIPKPKGWGRGLLSPNRALGLTGDWLIVVEDAQHRVRTIDHGVADYTMVRRFYPRVHVQAVTIEPMPERPDLVWARLRIGTSQAYVEHTLPMQRKTANVLVESLQRQGVGAANV